MTDETLVSEKTEEVTEAPPRQGRPNGLWAIFKKELGHYFTSPIAYFVAFATLLLTGLIFSNDLRSRVLYQAPPDGTVVLQTLVFLMIFLAPLLTMRLLAEETREGTLELLLTMPVRDGDIVLGKFLGAWAYFTIIMVVMLVYPFILASVSSPDQGVIITAYIGAWLFSGAALAIGLLFSAVTENQIVAGFLGVAAMVVLWLAEILAPMAPPELRPFLREISIEGHFSSSFARGVIDLTDVAYYVFMMAGALFITTRIVESRRWR